MTYNINVLTLIGDLCSHRKCSCTWEVLKCSQLKGPWVSNSLSNGSGGKKLFLLYLQLFCEFKNVKHFQNNINFKTYKFLLSQTGAKNSHPEERRYAAYITRSVRAHLRIRVIPGPESARGQRRSRNPLQQPSLNGSPDERTLSSGLR